MIEGHGDDLYKYAAKIKINFSSNINTNHDTQKLQNRLISSLHKIHLYPEPDALSLRKALSFKYNIDADSILVTNGATEAIYLLAQAYRPSNTAILIPTFSEYEDACTIHNHSLTYYQDIEQIESHIEMIWICNPNNPDGRIYSVEYLMGIVKKYPNTIFIIDQSYADLSDTPTCNIEDAREVENLVLLHSMTKQYAIPGLRLGYITAHPSIINKVKNFRMPWSINTLAIEAGIFLLQEDEICPNRKELLDESQRLQEELSKIKGLKVITSPMHYFLCELDRKSSTELKNWLIDKHSILIRDASNFRGLNERCFRIAAQSKEENNQLIKALKEWI